MMRALLAAFCLVGLVLGGALAPTVGIGTPIPDLGVEGEGGPATGGSGVGGAGTGTGSGGDLGVANYGGVSAGGYPVRATVGGRLRTSDHEALRIESPEPRRWRMGAYATYTGDGWTRNVSDPAPLTEPLPTTIDGRVRPGYEVQVTALRSFESLVSPWRPAFAVAGDRRVSVDRERALTVDDRLEAGDRYTIVTYGRVPRESAAVASDGDYPAGIEARYTQLPDDTPDRLGNRTAAITEDAQTPYEAAVAVEAWLEDSKGYSLNATHDRDADVATEFVFEMEAGYCQYFATAMVAMLRTQDVPARYVTGYGPGEPVGDGEYLVRGENAHAWVEVYVADVGWVTFDPTPAEARAEAGRDVRPLDELGDDWTGNESASAVPTATDDGAEETTVTLSADPVPGRRMSAVVTQDNRPVKNANVTFNGRDVGRTNRAGAVAGRVPYATSLNVNVRVGGEPVRQSGVTAPERGGDADVRTGPAARNARVSFDLPTDVSIELLDRPVAGGSVRVVATLADEPLADATVTVDGRAESTTDERGAAVVTLPDGNVTEIEVERGAASATRTVALVRETESAAAGDRAGGGLALTLEPRLPVALPATSATVTVSSDGQPLRNATVVVDGRTAGQTGPNGSIDVRLPFADAATVTATVPISVASEDGPNPARGAGVATSTLTGSARVDGLRRNAGAAAGALLVLGVGLGATVRWRIRTVRASTGRARRGVAGTLRRAIGSLLGVAGIVEWLVGRGRRVLDSLGERPAGLAAIAAAVAAGVLAAGGRLRSLDPVAVLVAIRGDDRAPMAAEATDAPATAVRAAWAELRGYVTVPSWRTSTPGEIARWAVDRDDLPPDAVATLRDAFREVEYGVGRGDDRVAEVRDAIEEIRASNRADDAGREVADD